MAWTNLETPARAADMPLRAPQPITARRGGWLRSIAQWWWTNWMLVSVRLEK